MMIISAMLFQILFPVTDEASIMTVW